MRTFHQLSTAAHYSSGSNAYESDPDQIDLFDSSRQASTENKTTGRITTPSSMAYLNPIKGWWQTPGQADSPKP